MRAPHRFACLLAAVSLFVGCDRSDSASVGASPAAAQSNEVTPGAVEVPESAAPEPSLGPRARVKLLVLGEFPEAMMEKITERLIEELQVEVLRLPDRPLPRSAYYPPRRRYRADRLLEDELEPLLEGEPETTKVIGLTSVDISTTARGHRDWGVLGLGQLGGRASIISSFRMRRRLRDEEQFEHRVVSTAVHEVGHTLGLDHCTEPRCVMNDAHGSISTVDRSDGHLGPECRAEVDRRAPQPEVVEEPE